MIKLSPPKAQREVIGNLKSFAFPLYITCSLLIYSYIYMETIYIGSHGFDDPIGWGRLFPADIDFYSTAKLDLETWSRNTPILYVINSVENLWLFYISFTIFQIIIFKIYKIINKNNIFLLMIFILNINLVTIFINKEFFSFISIGLIIIYINNNKLIYLILSLIAAFLSRPEMLFLFIFFALTFKLRYLKFIFLILIITLSIFYSNFPGYDSYEAVLLENSYGNNAISAMLINDLAKNYYIYGILLPIKLLMSLKDGGLYYSFFMIIMIAYLIIHRSLFNRESKQLLYFLSIFILYSTYPAFVHFRYLSPALLIIVFLVFQINLMKKNSRADLIVKNTNEV